jgi:hypothetical protein
VQVANALFVLKSRGKKKMQCIIVVNNLRTYPKHCSSQLALALLVDDLDVRGACQRFNNTLFFIWLLSAFQ